MNNLNPNFYMSVHTCSNMSINACLQGFCPFDDAKVAPFLDVHNSRNPLVKVPVKQLPILKKFL